MFDPELLQALAGAVVCRSTSESRVWLCAVVARPPLPRDVAESHTLTQQRVCGYALLVALSATAAGSACGVPPPIAASFPPPIAVVRRAQAACTAWFRDTANSVVVDLDCRTPANAETRGQTAVLHRHAQRAEAEATDAVAIEFSCSVRFAGRFVRALASPELSRRVLRVLWGCDPPARDLDEWAVVRELRLGMRSENIAPFALVARSANAVRALTMDEAVGVAAARYAAERAAPAEHRRATLSASEGLDMAKARASLESDWRMLG